MRITFEEVNVYATKSCKCSGGCGRTLRRSRKFWQTINPYNVTADGRMKSRSDILPELYADMDKWRGETEQCRHCTTAREGR